MLAIPEKSARIEQADQLPAPCPCINVESAYILPRKVKLFARHAMQSSNFRSFVLLLACSLLVSSPAMAAEIYKYRLSDGSIMYSQEKLKGGKLLKVLPGPVQDAKQRRAQIMANRELEQLRARSDRIALELAAREIAENDARLAALALERSELALASSLIPGPGDRLGTVGGNMRLTEAYLQRVRQVEAALESRLGDDATERDDTQR